MMYFALAMHTSVSILFGAYAMISYLEYMVKKDEKENK